MFPSPLKYALAFSLLLPSIASAGETSPVPDSPSVPDLEAEIRAVPTLVWVDPINDLVPEAVAAAEISKILFINRCAGGCTINPGLNDARSNSSTIASGTQLLSEFQWSDEVWNDTIDCIRDVYAPYDVEVVTDDPGTELFHHEAILAGFASELGLGAGIGGIAPADCEPLNNVMSFSFANQDGNPINMCWTVAQESAHSFGLPNHAFNCLDPMTYIRGCGKKYFRNQNYPCGEFSEAASCRCSGSRQNSHRELLNVFGKGSTVIPGPAVNIALPAMDEAVMGRFPIFWNASDERLISHSEVWVNGSIIATIEGNDYASQQNNINYNIQAPENLADGYLDIEIKAFSDIGIESVAAVTVLKGAPCANADSCLEFQSCENGRCSFPPATKELGESCDVVQECVEGVCADFGTYKSCTVTCNPNVTGGCAMDFECVAAVSGDFVCQPPDETGGCCSVAGTKRDPLPWLGAGLFLLGLMILRRKRIR